MNVLKVNIEIYVLFHNKVYVWIKYQRGIEDIYIHGLSFVRYFLLNLDWVVLTSPPIIFICMGGNFV